MIWRLVLVAEKTFRKLNAPELCVDVYRGALFSDGELVKTKESNRERAAA